MASTAKILEAHSHSDNPDIGLSKAYLKDMSEKLTAILADTYKLTIKSHIYHWNVVGPLFKPLHELTEAHYEALFEAADIVAERIRALGQLAPVDMGAASSFAPAKGDTSQDTATSMVRDLIRDHEKSVKLMREAATAADEAGDFVTADMLTDRLTFHEKALWMLRAIVAS